MNLIVIVLAEFFQRLLDIIVICLFEVLVDLRLFVRVNHLFDEVIDVDLRAAEHNRLQLVQHLLHRHTVTLGQIVQIHTTVNCLNDLFLAGTLLGNRANA